MKKILSIILTLVLVCCIAFECSTQSSAAFGIDDAILVGTVALDLLSLGITFHSASQFVQSDTFKTLCNSISHDIDQGIRVVKRNGKLFFATAKMVWNDIVNWVKGKFKPGQTVTFNVDTPVESHPQTLTLADGTVVPWAGWMNAPFFIYRVQSSNNVWGVYTSGANPGVNYNSGGKLYRILCTGRGKLYLTQFLDGSWQPVVERSMTYGITYKDETGSFADINLPSVAGNDTAAAMQYRTMGRTKDNGTPTEEEPPDIIPPVGEIVPVPVTASSDATYYPGAVDSPTQTISDDEEILIPVPDNMIVEAGTIAETITTDPAVIGNTIADTIPAEVNPHVLTDLETVDNTVGEIIADTPAAEIPDADVNNPDADIATANKFRLPKSFLEGFPFSIPYSVYVGIQTLVSDPQVPTFNVPFSIPRLGISENVEIDLTQWNPVARLCRALLSLVWVAGLAMACSKFLKR